MASRGAPSRKRFVAAERLNRCDDAGPTPRIPARSIARLTMEFLMLSLNKGRTGVEGEGEGCFLDGRVRRAGVEQPGERSRADVAPVAAQVLEDPVGERDHAFGAALGQADVQQLLVGLDVGELLRDGLRDAQTAGIGEQHCGAVPEVRGSQQQALDLIDLEIAREGAGGILRLRSPATMSGRPMVSRKKNLNAAMVTLTEAGLRPRSIRIVIQARICSASNRSGDCP